MRALLNRLLRLTDALAVAAAAALLGVVATTVLGRLAFTVTGLELLVPGAIEMAEHALLVLVFAALPRAAVAGLVRVEMLAERLPRAVARVLDRIWSLGLTAFGGIVAILLADEAAVQAGRGDVTQDLSLPLALVTGYAAVGSATVGLAALLHALAPREEET